MAFDSDTRNKLAKLVTDARTLLNSDFTEQLQEIYGIQPDGKMTTMEKLAHQDDYQRETARILRERVAHLASAMKTEKKPLASAVDRMTREQSFTILNRFAALRMCEERGLSQQCVGGGLNAKGFQVYQQTAGSALGSQYERYRTFLYCVFDEIAVDLGILFDRFSSFGLLFPRESALIELLEIINRDELKHIWVEDEAIGWIYQYFNVPEERRAMRKASTAPRNSRELAVRNQFFTPRYVVEFLTDNTLGRIWYEMRKGDTGLKDECRYLVRRPNEVFLAAGEKAPSEAEGRPDLSQEELIQRPVFIEHRPKKDPRDLRVLDPACGSGHFLLYAFDLLERIYEEAWSDPESPKSETFGRTLFNDFETLDDLRREAPKLIMEHNLHGIDIDPRAVQIAALSLWLQAQKKLKYLGIKVVERPRVTKSKIVTAEPMPGEEYMKEEFTAGLKPRVLGQLVDAIFDKMKLAGEAGSILKIEEEIKDIVSNAKELWLKGPRPKQRPLSPGMGDQKPKQQELQFDFKGVTDEGFWTQAEDNILDALKVYSDKTENGQTVRRRLFAEDAAGGFAFIDLCRKSYDVVLMNPPFGEICISSKAYVGLYYKTSKNDMYAIFVERGMNMLSEKGKIGAITSRTGFFLSTFYKWRKNILLKNTLFDIMADLGHGVMDSAMVEAAAYIIERNLKNFSDWYPTTFINCIEDEEKEVALYRSIRGLSDSRIHSVKTSSFSKIPSSPFAYWAPKSVAQLFKSLPTLQSNSIRLGKGPDTGNDFRFLRLFWEISPSYTSPWMLHPKGGPFSRYYADPHIVIDWTKDGEIIGEHGNMRNPTMMLRPGITWSRRTTSELSLRILPKQCIFADKGPALIVEDDNPQKLLTLLSILNSSVFSALVGLQLAAADTAARSYEVGILASTPLALPDTLRSKKLSDLALRAWMLKRNLDLNEMTSHSFLRPALLDQKTRNLNEAFQNWSKKENDTIYELNLIQHEIDMLSLQSYGLTSKDMAKLIRSESTTPSQEVSNKENSAGVVLYEIGTLVSALIDYLTGCAFAVWDIRLAKDINLDLKLSGPFEPLPACPTGMLVNPDGLPAEPKRIVSEEWLFARPDANSLPPEGVVNNPIIPDTEYPIRIAWHGILVDDPGLNSAQPHHDDIVRRVREILELLWEDKSHEIEQEACDILNVSDLRDYFRKSAKFFQDHLKRYSKSRRKAPIYWPLSTPSCSYTLWIYYHRLTDQTLYTCVQDYVDPKIKDVSGEIAIIQKDLGEGGNSKLRSQLEKLMDFQQELTEFKDELLRLAKLPYQPNLNDGVMITAAPLWKLFQLKSWQKDLKSCWDKLEARDYDWAHLAYSIWPDRVRETCKKERSIAIAHGLEEICEVETPKKAKKRKKK